MPLRIPRLGLPKWLALLITAIVVMAWIFYWPEPYARGPFSHRIGFCIEWNTDRWVVSSAPDKPPAPTVESNPNLRGLIVYSGDNTRGWKMTLYQRASARTFIESHSETLTGSSARSTLEGLRFELAAAAESIARGANRAVAIEPATIDRTLWINVLHRLVGITIIGSLWWILGKRGDDRV